MNESKTANVFGYAEDNSRSFPLSVGKKYILQQTEAQSSVKINEKRFPKKKHKVCPEENRRRR